MSLKFETRNYINTTIIPRSGIEGEEDISMSDCQDRIYIFMIIDCWNKFIKNFKELEKNLNKLPKMFIPNEDGYFISIDFFNDLNMLKIPKIFPNYKLNCIDNTGLVFEMLRVNN